jgi:hypothetical protein
MQRLPKKHTLGAVLGHVEEITSRVVGGHVGLLVRWLMYGLMWLL